MPRATRGESLPPRLQGAAHATRVMLVCSAGGHLAEMQRILPAFDGCQLSLVTYRSSRDSRPLDDVTTLLVDKINLSLRPVRLLRAVPTYLRVRSPKRVDVTIADEMDHVPLYLVENIGISPLRLLQALPTFLRALWRERPAVIVSTGSEIAIPFFYLGRMLGIKTLYVESCCRVRTPSGTGRLVYPVADRFFVQWESLLERFGPKAEFGGRVL